MNQFTVPQFIDVEDKIIGPVTTRQFIIMLAGALLIFTFYKIFAFTYFIIFAGLVFIGSIVLAFVRINGQPFHFFLLNILQTWRSPNLQIWDKTTPNAILKQSLKLPPSPPAKVAPRKTPLTASRLAEIALQVDTGGVYSAEEV
ncbi:PrgI family protein [Candidatus Uhrbacteria bacterium]|nr:PrgI family protein [Candidatus Uhrbacteria bacterium]